MNVFQKSVSQLIREEKESDEPKKISREEFRKEKELEEARKAGTVPALVDEEGKDINPHIPQYISTTPWYYQSSGPTLKHQRPQEDKTKKYNRIDEWYQRGPGKAMATRWREGACENCGAMGHDRKSCFEKPRKVPARYTNVVLAPDEKSQPNLNLDYDGKRDRWNGFDPKMYKIVEQEFEKIEEAKKKMKEKNILTSNQDPDKIREDDSDTESDDDERYAERVDMPGTKVDSKQRITVRNLRIREDTAKYLRNLDPDSAYYDPKTRAMRDNPYKNTGKNPAELPYAGENYVRYSGATTEVSKMQLFAWDAHEKGVDVHLQADPSKAELLFKKFVEEKTKLKSTIKSSILEKYGGEEHLKPPPDEIIHGQDERYFEYSRDGKLIVGVAKPVAKSKYEEDVFPKNHTSVWGSYYEKETQKWGYKCCKSTMKNSYCLRSDGDSPHPLEAESDEEESAKQIESEKEISEAKKSDEQNQASTSTSTSSISIPKERWSELSRDKRKRRRGNDISEKDMMDDRKRPYNSMYDYKEPTEEEMEEYRKNKKLHDDPLANFL
ncbi:pre-mRNA-splicing factor Slu7 [Brevipalpus obovatus]|uniref:pre-mRNA-splicing factor Slu7 n=1 Tax=Brevipalpus obovatus TaxID=246614 RepID=UPI003D9E005A